MGDRPHMTTMTMRVALLPLALIVLFSAPGDCMLEYPAEPSHHSWVRHDTGSFAYANPYVRRVETLKNFKASRQVKPLLDPYEELIEEMPYSEQDWEPAGQPGLESSIGKARHKREEEQMKHDGLKGDDVLSSTGLESATSKKRDMDLVGDNSDYSDIFDDDSKSKSKDTMFLQGPTWARDGPPTQDGGAPSLKVKKGHIAKKRTAPKKKKTRPSKLA